MQSGVIRVLAAVRMIRYLWASLGSLLSSLSSACQLSAVLIVVFCVAAVVAAAVRAVGPFRRVRGQALLPLAPHVMPRCS